MISAREDILSTVHLLERVYRLEPSHFLSTTDASLLHVPRERRPGDRRADPPRHLRSQPDRDLSPTKPGCRVESGRAVRGSRAVAQERLALLTRYAMRITLCRLTRKSAKRGRYASVESTRRNYASVGYLNKIAAQSRISLASQLFWSTGQTLPRPTPLTRMRYIVILWAECDISVNVITLWRQTGTIRWRHAGNFLAKGQ